MGVARYCILALLCLCSAWGLVIPVGNQWVEFATEGASAFRVSVAYDGAAPSKIDTPMIDNHPTSAPYTSFSNGPVQGIKSSFGSIQINTVTGAFSMSGSSGNAIVNSPIFSVGTGSDVIPNKTDTCLVAFPEQDVSGGQRTPGCPNGLINQTVEACCAACNKDVNCTIWVYSDTEGSQKVPNCWLMMNVPALVPHAGRIVGGTLTPGPPLVTVTLGATSSAVYYGAGAGGPNTNSLNVSSSTPQVANTQFFTPHYWTTDGYAALVVAHANASSQYPFMYPANWTATTTNVTWMIAGVQADIYLMPAATSFAGIKAYWDLTGAPRIPPRYTFGFLACRWGWQNESYIESMLTQFRSGNYPIDAWISDFGWYTPVLDYNFNSTGEPTFHDFGYNNATFPRPPTQLTHYHNDLHMRFGGIRKPRLGNTAALANAHANGWILAVNDYGSRNLDFSIPALRSWYSDQQLHYLQDGVNFWWNDEGETEYFTFHWWNMAHLETLTKYNNRTTRYFSINRSYTPGMQRMGLAVWTGDVGVSWASLAQQPGYLLNWAMAGVAYMTCDIGGFNGPNDTPDLLVRWYQLGVFLPIMRVHSTLGDMPHFPFLYGPVAGAAMREALNLRYSLVPMLYSLAHGAYANGVPAHRALIMEFPTDQNALGLTSQWLTGDSLMVAPVTNEDAYVSVYLPNALWYEFNTSTSYQGPQTLSVIDIPLNAIPVYVRAGGIIPLAPIIQYTDQLPGGPLQIQVYGGANGNFTLIEDDGLTYAYEQGAAMQRATTFTWTDATKTLAWTVQGVPQDAHAFTQLQAVGFFPDGSTSQSAITSFGTGGSLTL